MPALHPGQGWPHRRGPHQRRRAGQEGRVMNLVGLATRNLRRRPMRTALTIVGIALAVGSALALVALSRSIENSTREGIDELGTDLTVTQKGAPDLFGGFLSQQLAPKL